MPQQTQDLKDQVALVTGASSGIGKAIAIHLAERGARVGLLSRDVDDLKEVEQELKKQGDVAISLAADVSKPEEMQRAITKLADRWSRLDLVVENAGMNGTWAPIEELTPEEWQQTLNVNLTGTFLTLKYCLPHLKKMKGSVVIISSVNGTRMFSNVGASAYATSKAGQIAFMKMAALELAQFGVRVNAICPGYIETPIHDKTERRHLEKVDLKVDFEEGKVPLTHGDPGSPEDVAQLAGFLLSSAAKHITGTEMWIDGGQSLLQG